MSEIPQIQWAIHTKVIEVTRDSVKMTRDGIEAEIDTYGDVTLMADSRENIKEYMTQSEKLTRSLRKHLSENSSVLFLEDTQEWLRGKEVDAPEKGPWAPGRPGILDWWPAAMVRTRETRGRLGEFRGGWTQGISDDWIGSKFRYVHFTLRDDQDEGLAIKWDNDSKAQVWLGDVSGFFSANEQTWEDSETYSHYNGMFENGLLWALDYLGVFDGRRISKHLYGDGFIDIEIPQWVGSVVQYHSELLWPELVEKLMKKVDAIPDELRVGVLTWVDNYRRECERLTEQKYFWENK